MTLQLRFVHKVFTIRGANIFNHVGIQHSVDFLEKEGVCKLGSIYKRKLQYCPKRKKKSYLLEKEKMSTGPPNDADWRLLRQVLGPLRVTSVLISGTAGRGQ